MAEAKRQSLKTIDAAQMALGVYAAQFKVEPNPQDFVADIRSICPEFDTLSEMARRTLCYGLKQKLDDAQAGAEDAKEAYEEAKSTWDAIVAGKWTMRVAGEGAAEAGGIFARAFAQRHGLDLSEAKARIGALVEKNVAANRTKNPDVTERQVFNGIKAAIMEQDGEFGRIYAELAAKRGAKKKGVEIDLS